MVSSQRLLRIFYTCLVSWKPHPTMQRTVHAPLQVCCLLKEILLTFFLLSFFHATACFVVPTRCRDVMFCFSSSSSSSPNFCMPMNEKIDRAGLWSNAHCHRCPVSVRWPNLLTVGVERWSQVPLIGPSETSLQEIISNPTQNYRSDHCKGWFAIAVHADSLPKCSACST